MSKHIFDMAMTGATSSSGPASGSHHDHALYGGSCKWNMRYEYNEDSPAAFVELYPSWIPTIEEFKDVLKKVPGVTMVEWQTTKVSQGKCGIPLFRQERLSAHLDWTRLCQSTHRV